MAGLIFINGLKKISAPRGADGIIHSARRQDLFHLRALLRRQYLIHLKIVLHAVITHLLINLAEGRQLIVDRFFIPFTGINHVYQSPVFNFLLGNLLDITLQLLMQAFNFRDLIVGKF